MIDRIKEIFRYDAFITDLSKSRNLTITGDGEERFKRS